MEGQISGSGVTSPRTAGVINGYLISAHFLFTLGVVIRLEFLHNQSRIKMLSKAKGRVRHLKRRYEISWKACCVAIGFSITLHTQIGKNGNVIIIGLLSVLIVLFAFLTFSTFFKERRRYQDRIRDAKRYRDACNQFRKLKRSNTHRA